MALKNLILIRHAKSSWEIPINDIDSPLNERGIADAHLVAKNCQKWIPPNSVLWCSTAKRTKETAIIFAETILYPVESIVFKEELYTFDENQLEKFIKSIKDTFENVILFVHNEAITNFVNEFGDVFIDHIPTAGFVWLELDVDSWKKIKKGKTKKTIFSKNLK